MNNREAFALLDKNLAALNPNTTSHGVNADPSYTFNNLIKYRKAFVAIRDSELPGLSVIEEAMRRIEPLLKENIDKLSFSFSDGYGIDAATKLVYNVLNSLFVFLASQLSNESPDSLNIKIQKIDDLNELEKISSMLKKSFDMPVVQMGGRITVDGLENGSAWIILGVKDATGNALKLCANLIWSAAVILNKRDLLRANQAFNTEIRLPDSMKEQILEFQTSYISDSINMEANSISREFISENDPETLGRLKLALETIGDLIEKGVEFYPSVEASQEVKKLFPDPKTMKLIESKTLLIS